MPFRLLNIAMRSWNRSFDQHLAGAARQTSQNLSNNLSYPCWPVAALHQGSRLVQVHNDSGSLRRHASVVNRIQASPVLMPGFFLLFGLHHCLIENGMTPYWDVWAVSEVGND